MEALRRLMAFGGGHSSIGETAMMSYDTQNRWPPCPDAWIKAQGKGEVASDPMEREGKGRLIGSK